MQLCIISGGVSRCRGLSSIGQFGPIGLPRLDTKLMLVSAAIFSLACKSRVGRVFLKDPKKCCVANSPSLG